MPKKYLLMLRIDVIMMAFIVKMVKCNDTLIRKTVSCSFLLNFYTSVFRHFEQSLVESFSRIDDGKSISPRTLGDKIVKFQLSRRAVVINVECDSVQSFTFADKCISGRLFQFICEMSPSNTHVFI